MSSSSSETKKTTLSDVPTPAFVINRRALLRNCRRVRTEIAARNGAAAKLRPHVKTHKTMEGAYVQAFGRLPPKEGEGETSEKAEEEEGAEGGTGAGEGGEAAAEAVGFVASTLPEISMLLAASVRYAPRGRPNPFEDVLYGAPISRPKLERIDALRKGCPGSNVHVLIDHPDQLEMCEQYVGRSALESGGRGGGSGKGGSSGKSDVGTVPYFTAFLKIDTGYHRAGVPPTQLGLELAAKLMTSKSVKLRGIYSHCGHAYDAATLRELDDIAQKDVKVMAKFLEDLTSHMEGIGWGEYARLRVPNLVVSVGSTPSLFHHSAPPGDDNGKKRPNLELHPGNYALFDRQQLHSGACPSPSHIAGTVLSTVIGHYPDRNTILLDAGALALSKDGTPQGGTCAIKGWEDELECVKTSQEVTVVRAWRRNEEGDEPAPPFPFESFPLGSKVRLLPNHSCLAAACFDRYYVVDEDEEEGGGAGNAEVVDEWVPARGWW